MIMNIVTILLDALFKLRRTFLKKTWQYLKIIYNLILNLESWFLKDFLHFRRIAEFSFGLRQNLQAFPLKKWEGIFYKKILTK